jgi:Protein of unknown function (DUF4232)
MSATRNHARKTRSAARAAALFVGAGVAVAACGTAAHSATNHPTPQLPTKPVTHVHVVSTPTKPVTVETVKPSQPSTPAPSSVPLGCADTQVFEKISYSGAGMGSRFLQLSVTNVSSTTCSVAGPASFIMTGENGEPLMNGVNWPPASTHAQLIDLAPGASAYMNISYAPVNLGPGTPQTGCAILASVQAGMSDTQGVGGGVVVPLPAGPTQVCGGVDISFLSTSAS